jgi:iron complex outermembrane recepter protein
MTPLQQGGVMKQHYFSGLRLGTGGVALGIFLYGHIVQADSSTSPAVSQGNQLEEVIVTARRREENIQTVPIAITVVSQQTLQDNNVQTLGDLQFLVPSMSTSSILTRDSVNVSIRGQGANTVGSAPGVVAYLNEVPIPAGAGGGGELAGGPGLLFDLENAQILKGPQGTLFGRNSVGGAILLQTARPTNDFGGHMQVGYGNYNDREFDGAVNLPIIDSVLLTRIAINGQVRDGFTFVQGEPSHPTGIDADDRDYWSGRGTVTFRPSDSFQNDTIVSYSNYESHGSPRFLIDLDPKGLFAILFPSVTTLFAQQQALGDRTHIPVDTDYASSGSNLSLNNISRLNISDGLTFRNIFGYDFARSVLAVDSDSTALPIIGLPSTPRVETTRQFTEEAQVLGTAFAGRFDWIAGAFYLDAVTPSNGYVLQTEFLFGLPADSLYQSTSKSKALFAQGNYDLGSILTGLKFTGGIRYTWDENTSNTRGGIVGSSVCTMPQSACGPSTQINLIAKSNALTWTAGLDYQASEETLLYLSSRRGYRPGGFNSAGQPGYNPEYVDDFELGVKSDWMAGTMPIHTNADIYYQDYKDIQVQQSVVDPQGIFILITNAAAARIWGGEFEAHAQLTHDLQLGATLDYLSFDYTSFDPGVQNSDLLIATRTYNNPTLKYGVNARYQLPLSADIGNISARANWVWQRATSANLASLADADRASGTVPAFGLLNLSAEWNAINGTHLDASLFASNALNKQYLVGSQSFYTELGAAIGIYGEPRMYGIRLRYRFGAE